jgi:hypothetical protein
MIRWLPATVNASSLALPAPGPTDLPGSQSSRRFARGQAYDGRHSAVGRAFMHVSLVFGDSYIPKGPEGVLQHVARVKVLDLLRRRHCRNIFSRLRLEVEVSKHWTVTASTIATPLSRHQFSKSTSSARGVGSQTPRSITFLPSKTR